MLEFIGYRFFILHERDLMQSDGEAYAITIDVIFFCHYPGSAMQKTQQNRIIWDSSIYHNQMSNILWNIWTTYQVDKCVLSTPNQNISSLAYD